VPRSEQRAPYSSCFPVSQNSGRRGFAKFRCSRIKGRAKTEAFRVPPRLCRGGKSSGGWGGPRGRAAEKTVQRRFAGGCSPPLAKFAATVASHSPDAIACCGEPCVLSTRAAATGRAHGVPSFGSGKLALIEQAGFVLVAGLVRQEEPAIRAPAESSWSNSVRRLATSVGFADDGISRLALPPGQMNSRRRFVDRLSLLTRAKWPTWTCPF
jgi:hypothetical protein